MIPHAKPLLGKEEEDRVLEVLRSGMLAAGSYVQEFEEQFKRYHDSKYAIATSSGTTALHVILQALGIGAGDKVITTPYSFIATANAILYAGATPVFVDIDPATYNLSPSALNTAVKDHPEAKAVLIVHLFGLPADMDAILEIANKYNLIILEDCAQAHGATYQEQKVGTFGKASAFSFYPTKNITSGEGGIVLTDDSMIEEKVRILVNQGQRQRYYHEMVGYNYRMTNIHAAIGLEQLKKLDLFNQKRIENAKFYDDHIVNPCIQKPVSPPGRRHVYHQYTLKMKNRDAFTTYLDANGIGYGIHYPLIIPAQPAYKNMAACSGTWPVAEDLADSCVSIPVHPALSQSDLTTIVEVINNYR
ncbi:GDP-perosamine synthase [Sporomusa silvacetica DSM 10669]|uniref:GDP-perosamine synthase n=1 Tax=Sporomusa silvacetica DSM 10669 TaxID=1123289 RepID=A0ABZ3IVR7_9FIRM|nr:DegT/DnrJ/EryC1/StrS family aminotransferase [Sporomusa silvacetica]OZC15208.1 dTDP-3-amino-3,6-dideoxy-alpha-D-galactopyranose transaminase [Sporomusa silvacetica DSM 10669]